MGRKARICTIIILLSVIFIPLVPHPVDSVCPSSPGVTITIAQPKQTVNVAPGQDGIVTFTGTVMAQIPWEPKFQYLVVQLSPDADGWPTSRPPPLIFTRQVKMKIFSVDVYVPTGTSRSYHGQFSMGGKWRFQNTTIGGTLYPATAIIVVQQYDMVVLDSPERYIKIEQGQSLHTHVKVENRGNADEHLWARINNRKELESKGWKIDLTPDKMAVQEKNSTLLELDLSSSETMELGFHTLSIKVAIAEAGYESPFVYDHDIIIEVREMEMFGIKLGIWLIFEYSLIILLGMVTSFLVMIRRRTRYLPIRSS